MKKSLKHIAQAVLAVIMFGSVTIFLGAPSFFASLALLGAAALAALGLKKLGTF